MKTDNLIVKSNSLIEARYNYTVNEQRFILAYISMLNPMDDGERNLY